MIRLENVCKNFGDLQVLKNVNLEVKEGEKLVIIGPSGSGKSTTVRCMNFLEEPTSGHVYIDGQKLTHANKTKIIRESISMVFQQFNLYPHMTVLKNLTIAPMKLHHKSKKEAEDLAYHYLDVVGLRDKAHVYPTTLSGGQQQRIAIARALCAQTKIILFDEPTSALDPGSIGCHDQAGKRKHHHGSGHPRDGICQTGSGPRGIHGRWTDHRRGNSGSLFRESFQRARKAVPGQDHPLISCEPYSGQHSGRCIIMSVYP